jgi:hypothetical protein
MTLSRYLTRAAVLSLAAFGLAGCSDDNDPAEPRRVLTTVNVSVGSSAIEVGELTGANASGLDQDGAPIGVGPVTWASDAPTIAAVNPSTGVVFAIAPGATRITATVDGKVGERAITVSNAPGIRINEIQPSADTPVGWIELYNPTSSAVDLTGWTLIDSNFFGPSFTFPAGSVIQPNGFFVVEEATLPFGIDAADNALLFSRFGVLVDSRAWTSQPETTLGRCPDGSASFGPTLAPTKGAANACQ